MMEKYLADIENKKLQKILERAANHSCKLTHIKRKNKICNAISRLCTQICLYTHKYTSIFPRLLLMSKRASVGQKQLKKKDPLVMKMREQGKINIEYLEMLDALENDTETKDLPDDIKLRQLSGCKDEI